MPGIPVGPGTIFYLAAALAMPLVGICRRVAGRQSPQSHPELVRQVAVAVGMLLTGALSFWLFDLVGSVVDRHRHTGALVLTSPLLIALLVLSAMVAVRPIVRRLDRLRLRNAGRGVDPAETVVQVAGPGRTQPLSVSSVQRGS